MLPLIPKRIIQTGKQSEQPLHNRAVMANIRLLNPDFEYLFFDNKQVAEFIDREFPQYRAVFDGFRFPIQRYDFFRYLVVYHHGGFYFDLDVLLAKDLSPLLSSECVFPFEGLNLSHFLRNRYGMDWLIGNYAFGAAQRHPFLKLIIENCVKSQENPNWVKPMMAGSVPLMRNEFFVLNSTGPGLVSRTLAENPAVGSTVNVLFPEDVRDTEKWNRFGDFGIHLMDASWRPTPWFPLKKLAQLLEGWKLRGFLKKSRDLGSQRDHASVMNGIVGGPKCI